MNLTMMLLCDCVGGQLDESLYQYILQFGEITEARGVAFRDLG
jgi:hypothetical protein